MSERGSWLSRPLRSRLLRAAGSGAVPGRLRLLRQRQVVEPTAEEIAANDIATLEAADRQPTAVPAAPPGRSRRPVDATLIRLAALGSALVLTLALALVRLFPAGPPSIAQLRAEAGVDGWTVLPIGVKDDQPGVAYRDKAGIWTGFDIDIAYMIAEDLGFRRQDVRFYAIESEDRARMQATDPEHDNRRVPVKMVVASYSITAERVAEGVTFSAPYLYTEQSVITRPDHAPVATFQDLTGRRVCSLSTSTSLTGLGRARVVVVSQNRVSDCFALLDRGEVDAISTDAAILAGYKHLYPSRYAHWDLGLDASEKWGVNVGESKALQTLVDVTLYRSWKDPHDERWELAYQHNLQNEIPDNLPTPIAVAEQPPVPRPDVRQLPWETDLP